MRPFQIRYNVYVLLLFPSVIMAIRHVLPIFLEELVSCVDRSRGTVLTGLRDELM